MSRSWRTFWLALLVPFATCGALLFAFRGFETSCASFPTVADARAEPRIGRVPSSVPNDASSTTVCFDIDTNETRTRAVLAPGTCTSLVNALESAPGITRQTVSTHVRRLGGDGDDFFPDVHEEAAAFAFMGRETDTAFWIALDCRSGTAFWWD